jgi:Flp pilus assembly protein CpaB
VLVGIALVAAAAAMVLVAHRSANRPPRHRWLVAVAEVPVGTPLGRRHLGTAPIDLPRGVQAVAATDLDDVLGRVTARPLADGQLLTPDDLLAAGRFDGGEGIEVTVTLDERRWPRGGLDVGDRVDVLSTDPDGDGTRPLVSRARLVALDDDGDGGSGLGGAGGTRVRLAVPDAAAATALVDAAVREELTVVLPAPTSTGPPPEAAP